MKIKAWLLYNIIVVVIVILLVQEIKTSGIHHSTVLWSPLKIKTGHNDGF